MARLLNRLISKIQLFLTADKEEKTFLKAIHQIIGQRPYNAELYKLAMRHSSRAIVNEQGFRESNERLEYLGDAILDMIVAEFLFTRYPFKDEGFLTEVRSKIVNREIMNQISKKMGIKDLINFNDQGNTLTPKSIYGDSLEALIGAIYLDKGFFFTKKFVIRKLLHTHYDLDQLISTTTNYKSKIIEWSQKENKSITFEITTPDERKKRGQFTAQVVIDGVAYETGYGPSKKKAEQDAARRTLESLSPDEAG